MAFEYEAVINVKIGLIIEDHILGDTADVPLAEAFTSDGSPWLLNNWHHWGQSVWRQSVATTPQDVFIIAHIIQLIVTNAYLDGTQSENVHNKILLLELSKRIHS